MPNHFRNRLIGSKHIGLAPALLVSATLILSGPAWPSPPPRTFDRQIVVLVDKQGRKTYVNTSESDSPFKFVDSAWRNNCSALGGRNPGLASLISQTADRHQVDPDLIHAVVKVESGCDSRAVSPKGAMGLMQLIPATARRFGVENPFDPRQNIEGGTSYLKYLLGLFDGDLGLSLAAYNAGENSVLRTGGIPPFPETREYVRRVTSLYQPDSASKLDAGGAGMGNRTDEARRPKPRSVVGKASAVATRPTGAPLYSYVDAKGVLHIEQ